MPQSPQPAELVLSPEMQPLIRWGERVRDRLAERPGDYYARIRAREGSTARVIGDQIWVKAGSEDEWINAIAERLELLRSPSPVTIELLQRGGHSTLEAVTVSPLAEAVEMAIASNVQRAKIEGESATVLGLSEALLRLVNAREASMNARESRYLETWEKLTEMRITAARQEAEAETAIASIPPDPDENRWIEGLATLSEVFGPALSGLGAYLAALAGVPLPSAPPPGPPRNRPAPPAAPGVAGPEGAPPPPTPPEPSAGPVGASTGPEMGAPIVEVDPDTLADHLLGAIEELATAAPGVITSERKKRVASWLFRFRENAAPEAPARDVYVSTPAAPVEVPDAEPLPPEPGEAPEGEGGDPGA